MATEKIGIYFWVRVAVMFIVLLSVISLMRRLGPGGSTGTVADDQFQICPTRVSSVSMIGKTAVFQDGMKWYTTKSGERRELNTIAVERWFSEYCSVPADAVAAPETPGQPLVTLAFVAGSPMTLNFSPDAGVYSWHGRHFRSKKLDEALQALDELPIATPPGHTQGH